MVITISGTQVQIIGEPDIIFQNNNLVNTLAAVTDKDESWQYNVDIFMPNSNRYNSIIMTRNGNMLFVDLTRQMLPDDGRYVFQFRGQSGNAVYHTDKFCLWVKDSIDLNEAFYQMESEMKDILKQVQETAAETLPEINEGTSGKYLSNDGKDPIWKEIDIESGITQEQADARYLQLTGGTMSGNIDMGGSQVRGVRSIAADGATGNAGIQFASNGNFTNIVCGVSTSASFSANAVDFYNHNLDRVNSINMTSEATIEDAEYVGGNVEEASRTAIDFTTENAVGIWAQGAKQVNIDANGVDVNGNKITNVGSIVAEGSTVENIKFESNGTIVGIICGGTRSATFTASAIDAYDHTISRVGEPLNDTDAARKVDVDTVATTVNEIIDGTEVLPYLPEDGGTLSGPLNMGNNKITMGGTPTETTDVTNKGYVDGVVKVVSDEVDGILAGTTPVAIPVATETHVGGIKPGAGTAVSGDGTLTIIVPVPTVEDNGKILVAENGTYVLKTLAEIQG